MLVYIEVGLFPAGNPVLWAGGFTTISGIDSAIRWIRKAAAAARTDALYKISRAVMSMTLVPVGPVMIRSPVCFKK